MKKGKIVVIDDSIVNLKLVYDVLSSEGYTIIMQKEGAKAHHTCLIEQPDLILLDIIMPDANGIQLCKALKNDVQTAAIPVMFLTAKTESESLVDGFNAGGVDYITKPFNFKELVARVNTHVKLKRSLQTIQNQANELNSLAKAKDSVYEYASFATGNVYQQFKQIETTITDKIQLPEQDLAKLRYFKNTLALQLKNLQFWMNFKSGKVLLRKSTFDFNQLIHSYLGAFEYVFKQNNCETNYEVLYNNLLIEGNESSIKLAVLNALNFFSSKLKNNSLKLTSGVVDAFVFIEFEAKQNLLTASEITALKTEFGVLSENLENKEALLGIRIIESISELHFGSFKIAVEENLTKFRIELPK